MSVLEALTWLAFAAGAKGDKGDKGDTGAQGAQGPVGPVGSQGVQGVAGTNGNDGADGLDGINGVNGAEGLSAYEVALANGFVGTEAQWLISLKGINGANGEDYISNLQKTITYPDDFVGTTYTLTQDDNNYVLVIDNVAANVNIEVPWNLINSTIGFIQRGTGEVLFTTGSGSIRTPIPGAYKIKGQYYQAYIEQKHFSAEFFLLGNLKV